MVNWRFKLIENTNDKQEKLTHSTYTLKRVNNIYKTSGVAREAFWVFKPYLRLIFMYVLKYQPNKCNIIYTIIPMFHKF